MVWTQSLMKGLELVVEMNKLLVTMNEPTDFSDNLNEAMSALYPNCDNFTVLRFVLKMFKLKVRHGLSDIGFTEFLQLIKSVLPRDNKTPENTYRAEKLVKELGLTYEKIDACPNGCTLYYKEKASWVRCPKCKTSRYKIPTIEERKEHVRPAAKQLRYFPITDRLKRMYSVEWVAKEMCWHTTNRLKDGELGHPVDSSNWKHIDNTYPQFSSEPRNVRLGLATDGFNPFGMQSASYSSWPVMFVTYNLPPWLCMKPQFTMLTLLIEGPRQPGKDIDIFLRPLVDELNSLWKFGEPVKDANTGTVFNMRAVLLWTIHDLPAFGDISGCRTKGKCGCPCCGPDTCSMWLHHGKKTVYTDHRRFCAENDPIRLDVKESSFNKEKEERPQPMRLTGSKILEMTKDIKVDWGKGNKNKKKRKRSNDCGVEKDDDSDSCFVKRSILFDLEYWEGLPIRHSLDVMHIEKNVCEILLALMLDTKGKTKDDINARKDLKRLGIKKKYWLTDNNMKRRGPLCLRPDEKMLFLTTLKDIRVPIGFSSNWNNIVQAQGGIRRDWRNIIKGGTVDLKGMKSHDYHIIMQHFLPVLIQHAYKDRVQARHVLLSFCTFFRALCSRRIDVATLHTLEKGMVRTLCELEKMCPPSLFVIMMHLPVHLAYEARVMGPVFYRWMYVFERLMHTYKDYVTNKARPEGSIAERYIKEETLMFCGGYKGGGSILQQLEERVEGLNETIRNDQTKEGDEVGPIGVGARYLLEGVEFEQVRNWILKSHPQYPLWHAKYIEFLNQCKNKSGKRLGQYRVKEGDEFIPWLKSQTEFQVSNDDAFKDIVQGPTHYATSYNKYTVNGFLFITKDHEIGKINQNSGVCTKCPTSFRSSAKDKNPIDAPAVYYGVLRKIIQLEYRNGYKPVVFKSDWVKLQHGVKMDKDTNLLSVNLSNVLGSSHMADEPFTLAEHVSQVFYSKDPLDPEWHVVLDVPRKLYSDLDSPGLILEKSVVDESYAKPFEPVLENELIFDDEEDMVEVVDVRKPRKRYRKNLKRVIFGGEE